MENSWAKVGQNDAPDFETLAYLAVNSAQQNRNYDCDPLLLEISIMESAAQDLLNKLPENILAECKPQLEQFQRIAQADRLALDCLQNKNLNPKLLELRTEIKNHEVEAILSEKSALKFIDDVIDLLR